jgi:hypothetical protein
MANCGISQSLYRPPEQDTYAIPRSQSGIQILGTFVACEVLCVLEGLGVLEAFSSNEGRSIASKLAEVSFWFAVIVGFVFLAVKR